MDLAFLDLIQKKLSERIKAHMEAQAKNISRLTHSEKHRLILLAERANGRSCELESVIRAFNADFEASAATKKAKASVHAALEKYGSTIRHLAFADSKIDIALAALAERFCQIEGSLKYQSDKDEVRDYIARCVRLDDAGGGKDLIRAFDVQKKISAEHTFYKKFCETLKENDQKFKERRKVLANQADLT